MSHNKTGQWPSGSSVPGGAYLPVLALPANMPDGQLGIAEMADAFGVTHRTLHFYEEKRLLIAARIGQMRVYNQAHARRMAVINACREVEMPIAVLQELMDELDHAGSQDEAETRFRKALDSRKRELLAQQSNLRRQMQKVSELLDRDLNGQDGTPGLPQVHLSPIETRCIGFMAEGYQANRIATLMDMDLTAVLTLEAGIIRKFDSANRFQAIAKAVLTGMVDKG